MESLSWTIEEFFQRVMRGQKNFADLIENFRQYEKAIQMREYLDSLPHEVVALKQECTIIKFDCRKRKAA